MNYQRVATGLRLAELAFAIIVMSISGDWLARNDWAFKRIIYTMTVSAVASLLAVLWLFPFSATFVHWPGDTFISILWWVAFGLLSNSMPARCGFFMAWQCSKYKAMVAFCFLSALVWLASAATGIFAVRRPEDRPDGAKSSGGWFRRSQV
ncbi:hypothetical protein E4U43_006724 [Claviceps pusilla]|uniref:MARVEL domain-containing protein n=1 Tax=Claviceps pusilla TaxID=123648 RepID=A0A9P7T229_9HYPO|nr:hypothetical protein E4U43_006724 [Claviceps pusilla]